MRPRTELRSFAGAWFVRLALVLVAACSPASEPDASVLRTEMHAEADLLVVIHADGSLDVRRLATGVRRMRVPRYEITTRRYGHGFEVPVCPTQVSRDGHLLVVSANAMRVFALATGRLVTNLPYAANGPPRACPVITPDSALLVHLGRYHGSGRLVKLRWDGEELWHHDLPDVGPLVGAITIDPVGGRIVLTSATHLLSLDAEGRSSYAYGHGQPGGR